MVSIIASDNGLSLVRRQAIIPNHGDYVADY